MSVPLYINTSYKLSEMLTKEYSTSFSLAVSLLEKDKRQAIYAIYGFVRLADEIVDSLKDYDNVFLLQKLNDDFNYALDTGISTNPILAAFAHTVKRYSIRLEYIRAFMKSMEKDLKQTHYHTLEDSEDYIYGSAEVVGLMCLQVFCYDSPQQFEKLELSARKLGSAFQKVNFLRDLHHDMQHLGRCYFYEVAQQEFNCEVKNAIEQSIENDFDEAWQGIKHLPGRSKLAVALAYHYYQKLFSKIKKHSCEKVMHERIRIPNWQKYLIICKITVLYKIRCL